MQDESSRAQSRAAERGEQAILVMLLVRMSSARWSWRSAITSRLSMASVRCIVRA
jgi:hypothetical protein